MEMGVPAGNCVCAKAGAGALAPGLGLLDGSSGTAAAPSVVKRIDSTSLRRYVLTWLPAAKRTVRVSAARKLPSALVPLRKTRVSALNKRAPVRSEQVICLNIRISFSVGWQFLASSGAR